MPQRRCRALGYSGGRPQGKVGQQSSLDPLPFVRIALDEKLAFIADLMLPVIRRAGLSFGDRACLALANKVGVRATTANRAWPRIGSAVGVEIELIREYPH